MPRETVHTDVRPYGDDVPAVSAVEVTWGTGGDHVQLGTVMLTADTGEPFHGAVKVGQNGWVTMTGPGYVSGTPWPNTDPHYVGDTIFPQPSTAVPFPQIPGAEFQTIPMVPLDTGGIDKTGWCDDCKEGRHVQCADDTTEEHSPFDPDWCRCPCGEIKTALLEEENGQVRPRGAGDGELAEVELIESPGAGYGHFVQLNRKELNELIRKLKRAGKMTFGEDEW